MVLPPGEDQSLRSAIASTICSQDIGSVAVFSATSAAAIWLSFFAGAAGAGFALAFAAGGLLGSRLLGGLLLGVLLLRRGHRCLLGFVSSWLGHSSL